MKYIIALFIAIWSLSASAQAQEAGGCRGFIGVNAGYSMPMGKLTNTTYSDPQSGFAKAGFHLSLDGVYRFNQHWGIGGLLSFSQYNLKNGQNLSNGYNDDFATDSTTVTYTGYKVYNILAGPYYTLPFNKLSLDFRLLAGVMSASTPSIKVDLEDEASNSFEQQSITKTTVAGDAGIGLRYELVKHLAIKANLDYFYGKPEFNIINTNRRVSVGRRIDTYDVAFTGFNLTGGIAYQF